MSKSYFKAIHSNGTIHLRASEAGRPYAFAVVNHTLGRGASFASKRPPALNTRELGYGMETVHAYEISKDEHAALEKANKNFCTVKFRGKKYTHSDNVDTQRATHAICVHRDESKHRVIIGPDWHQSWHEKHPEGFYMAKISQDTRVWFGTRENCEREFANYQSLIGKGPSSYSVVELLEVTQL